MNMLRITNEIHIKRYPAKTLRLVVYDTKFRIEKVVLNPVSLFEGKWAFKAMAVVIGEAFLSD